MLFETEIRKSYTSQVNNMNSPAIRVNKVVFIVSSFHLVCLPEGKLRTSFTKSLSVVLNTKNKEIYRTSLLIVQVSDYLQNG